MAEQPVKVVAAACDGACSGNPGPGGWGALLRFEDGSVQEMGGSDPATTNNRMELTAALALLETLADLPRHPDLAIRTDSRYLIDGLQSWMGGWKRRGWRTAAGKPVLNRDLWERLDGARLSSLPLRHVRGHSGDPDNDRCDAIAVAFSRGQRPSLRQPDRPGSPPPQPSQAAADPLDEVPAPLPLQQLLGRMELADRLAAGGYSLTADELSRLVEEPPERLAARSAPWTWRDWRIRPLDGGRWRLERGAGG